MTVRAGWLVDAHVHLHEPFPVNAAFDAAAGHFGRHASDVGLPDGAVGCLMLAENEGETRFRNLRARGMAADAMGWSVHPTDEDVSLLVRHREQVRFVLIAGRQVVTADRLEVLTLGTHRALPNGVSLEQAIQDADDEHALAIIPWGLGKWWGRRGQRLARLVQSATSPRFYLGDNGGRARSLPQPPLLRSSVRRGVWDLPGSDALPLPGEAGRTGSYGFVVPVTPDLDRPFAQIRQAVAAFTSQPRLFGRRPDALRFVRTQARLRLRRWRPRGRP
jgi:hypothetical protein